MLRQGNDRRPITLAPFAEVYSSCSPLPAWDARARLPAPSWPLSRSSWPSPRALRGHAVLGPIPARLWCHSRTARAPRPGCQGLSLAPTSPRLPASRRRGWRPPRRWSTPRTCPRPCVAGSRLEKTSDTAARRARSRPRSWPRLCIGRTFLTSRTPRLGSEAWSTRTACCGCRRFSDVLRAKHRLRLLRPQPRPARLRRTGLDRADRLRSQRLRRRRHMRRRPVRWLVA